MLASGIPSFQAWPGCIFKVTGSRLTHKHRGFPHPALAMVTYRPLEVTGSLSSPSYALKQTLKRRGILARKAERQPVSRWKRLVHHRAGKLPHQANAVPAGDDGFKAGRRIGRPTF